MTVKIKPMTKSELRQYVEAYRPFFDNWTAVRGEGFVRISGPVAQQVWFENLRSGAYRPVSAISILVAKGGAMLHSFLDIRHREILPREHDLKFERVYRAMSEQFVPSIISPLNAIEVRQLCEERATGRINDAHSLSALNAYLGDYDAASKWIATLKRLTKDRTDLEDWEVSCVRAANALEEAIANDNVKVALDEIRMSEESRLLQP
ncbi:MAG: hypothetical protein U0996_22605 [Planctomycetaceae bacterium]